MILNQWNIADIARNCFRWEQGIIFPGAFQDIRVARSRSAFRYSLVAHEIALMLHPARGAA